MSFVKLGPEVKGESQGCPVWDRRRMGDTGGGPLVRTSQGSLERKVDRSQLGVNGRVEKETFDRCYATLWGRMKNS